MNQYAVILTVTVVVLIKGRRRGVRGAAAGRSSGSGTAGRGGVSVTRDARIIGNYCSTTSLSVTVSSSILL